MPNESKTRRDESNIPPKMFWRPGAPPPGSISDRESFKEAETASLVSASMTGSVIARLPILNYKRQLLYLLENHQTVVLVGETGCGKSTQIPQILFEAGWTSSGYRVGCTQPRRISATSVALRVSEEMGVSLGSTVGYCIRFEDCSSPETRICYMTDGVLARELMTDPLLSRYRVIMIDEAHERSVYTDILLGLIKRVLTRRSDLRVIVASATLDASEFCEYFNSTSSTSAVLKVTGRQFPVDIHYLTEPVDNYVERAVQTVAEIHKHEPLGDILVFLTGQEEIEAAMLLLEEIVRDHGESMRRSLRYLPLYAGLPIRDQELVFARPPRNCRKVIFATNVAETSITIQGISYVVDCGFVKITSYSPKNGIESLVVVPSSKASAIQRAGRAGRVKHGKAYRLYTQDYYDQKMPNKIPPEIERGNLGPTVLLLKGLGVANLVRFDFLSAPSSRLLLRAMELLCALEAIDSEGNLTAPLGLRMAELPLEPMFAKMLLSSGNFECSDDIATIAAMLQIQSVFIDSKAARASRSKDLFSVKEGDHLTYLNVYRAFIKNGKSSKWCLENFLNYNSLKRVDSVRRQLLRYMKRFGIPLTTCEEPSQICKCITASFFANAAHLSPNGVYYTIRDNSPLNIHPMSVLFEDAPAPSWIVFHELVLTKEAYMRDITVIEPEWLETYAPHFYSYTKGLQICISMSAKKVSSQKYKLVAFDIDETLWPFWVDTHVRPPFKLLAEAERHSGFEAKDRYGTLIKLFPDVREIIHKLKKDGFLLAAVSRTDDPPASKQLLKLLDLHDAFDFKEIYPGRKTTHFSKIARDSGVSFSEMIFFDDEIRNIHDMNAQGLKSVHVEGGITKAHIENHVYNRE
eukprot:Nk52_evm5s1401 gene=Nk52_evmTU5s1401